MGKIRVTRQFSEDGGPQVHFFEKTNVLNLFKYSNHREGWFSVGFLIFIRIRVDLPCIFIRPPN